MEYDKYTDRLYAENESLDIDRIFKIIFGYTYIELRLTEIPNADRTDKNLVAAGRAFKILNGWGMQRFKTAEDNMYPLYEYFAWIRDEAIVLRLKERVPGYEWPTRAARFMEAVLNAHKYPGGAAALKFVRRHDFWEIGFENVKHFKHQKGLIYLQFLLTHPSKSYSCLELTQLVPIYNEVSARLFEKNPDYSAEAPERHEDMAIKMKQDMAAMERELQKAEEGFRPDVDTLREELHSMAKAYNSLYDIKGRPRKAGSPPEKARSAVSKAIQRAKDELLEALPEMEPILNRVSLGICPEYSPGRQPVEVFVSPA